ncbi:Zinc finger and BTB domain-containing protein 37 [Bagarius yarrelli]|uniref:Zinc finger and BTB domain-containing protein 37 n=1 Tax=Bagarius yarrelli TaxID=175774 RepID=A0A556TSA1_BAGYA|nr:Zinc finger and BTB domain-containing protein 37 [Bagarius yarrelli]
MEVTEIREVSPPGESMSPQIVEHSGLGPEAVAAVNEPILRINRAGQWYVEAGPDMERSRDETMHIVEGLRIKTERMEEWMGAETQASAEEGSGTEEGPTVMIDTSGRSTLVQEGFITGASRAKSSQPTSSFSESERFSPTGSVVVMAERPRAKSESPGRVDDQRHPSSQCRYQRSEYLPLLQPTYFHWLSAGQGEEATVYDVGGYEEYLREQVGDRWFRYNPRLTCIYCCKSFNQKGSLDRHMRLHMGITPFVCRMCGKKYTRKDQLEYHIRKHTGNKPFHCHVCGKSFPFQAILNQHFRKNHPGCTPHDGSHSASPETTTNNNNVNNSNANAATPGRTQHDDDEESDGTGAGARGGASSFGEGIQPSVSTTGPD